MTLQEQIQNDFSKLLKEQNCLPKELLKVVIAELSRYHSKNVPDEEVIRIVKKMKENAIECGNLDEVPILEQYLPKMMKEEELCSYIKSIMTETGLMEMGKIMQFLKKSEHSSIIDMSTASKIVRELL